MTQTKFDTEQDLELKLRFMRYLWSTGYFVRKNVELPNLDISRSGQSYTDVDVVGIKFDKSFYPTIVVADCKSGRSTKKYERFFWLSGVMKYFQSSQGFYIREIINEKQYVEISNRLGIIPLSLSQLTSLEKIYNINSADFYSSFSQDQVKITDAHKTLRKKKVAIADYISSGFWGSPQNEQIVTLMVCLREINTISDIDEETKNFLLISSLSLFSIALLKFTREVSFIPEKDKEDYIKQALLGGKIDAKEKMKLLYSFYDFMKEEVQKKYNKKYPVSRTAFVDGLIPSYAKYLYEFLVRIQNNPTNSIEMPRILDYLSHNLIFETETRKLDEILSVTNIPDKHRLLRPINDLLTFLERSASIDSKSLNIIKEQVKLLESN